MPLPDFFVYLSRSVTFSVSFYVCLCLGLFLYLSLYRYLRSRRSICLFLFLLLFHFLHPIYSSPYFTLLSPLSYYLHLSYFHLFFLSLCSQLLSLALLFSSLSLAFYFSVQYSEILLVFYLLFVDWNSIFGKDRLIHVGGGVCFVTNNKTVTTVPVPVYDIFSDLEIIAIDILNSTPPTRVITCYSPLLPHPHMTTLAIWADSPHALTYYLVLANQLFY